MTFNSQSGRKAQAKRKTRGTGAYFSKVYRDPEEAAAMQARRIEKYGGEDGYKAEMKRRANLRWNNEKG